MGQAQMKAEVHEEAHDEDEGQGQPQGHLPELDLNGLWFDNNNVVRSITKVIKSFFHAPWKNYTEVDEDTKLQWWNIRKKQYRWWPELDSSVRDLYERKTGVRLKDLFNDTVHKRTARPQWLSEGLYKEVKAGVNDETFKLRSARAKANRRGGNIDGNPLPSHGQGTVSTTQRAKRLAKEKGKMPDAADVYLDTHFKTPPGKDPVPPGCMPTAKETVGNLPTTLRSVTTDRLFCGRHTPTIQRLLNGRYSTTICGQ